MVFPQQITSIRNIYKYVHIGETLRNFIQK